MKKISFIVLALCTSAAVFSQNAQPQLVTPMAKATRFGIRGGVNLADLTAKNLASGSMYTEAQSKTGFNGGIFVNIPIGSKNFRFQPELSYSSQGGKLQGPSGTTTATTYEQDLDYINLPLNFQLMSNNGFFIQTGPQLGFLVGAEKSTTSSTSGSSNGGGNKEDFDKLDFSWTGGVGYLTRFGLGLDLRYNIGIANVVADDASATAPLKGGTWKNSVGQFSLIYHFGASK
ncbi:MAG: PorT family protein [Chitinophagaceae bacterium]|nr:MAG: PorT family protein [Chitinophagaceae bacterium]